MSKEIIASLVITCHLQFLSIDTPGIIEEFFDKINGYNIFKFDKKIINDGNEDYLIKLIVYKHEISGYIYFELNYNNFDLNNNSNKQEIDYSINLIKNFESVRVNLIAMSNWEMRKFIARENGVSGRTISNLSMPSVTAYKLSSSRIKEHTKKKMTRNFKEVL